MREKLKDKERLNHIIESIDNISEFVRGKSFDTFRNDKILRFAIIKNIEIIGEAAYLLSEEFRTMHNEIEWKDLIGMRHILVHDYYQIKFEIVWVTIEEDLHPLREKIIKLINEE